MLFVGALGGIAKLFNTEEDFSYQQLIRHAVSGGAAALVGAAAFMSFKPEVGEQIILLGGVAVFSAFVGLPFITKILKKVISEKIRKPDDPHEQTGSLTHKKHMDISDADSATIREMLNTGEFTLEEFEQLLAEGKKKRQRAKASMENNRDD